MTEFWNRINRSALITAFLFTTMSVAQWATRQYVADVELRTILVEGIMAIGVALGVVSNSRPPSKDPRPSP